MSDRGFVAPVERVDDDERTAADPLGTFSHADADSGPRFRLNFDPDERGFLVNLLAELKALLTSDETEATAPLLHRLFPPAFHDDPEKEAEYQRLMRVELVASRVAAIDSVTALLSPGDGGTDGAALAPSITLSQAETMAFMQSLNAIRLVLGTMLDITDDESSDDAETEDSYEFGLYEHLGWILEFTVRALSGS
jgi:hypothetical protein